MIAKDISWNFREIVGPGAVSEWPTSLHYISNTALIDTIDDKVFIWLDFEMKATFHNYYTDNEFPNRSDRVEYIKIKLDSIEITPFTVMLDNMEEKRFSKVDIYKIIKRNSLSFDGSQFLSRIKFYLNLNEKKITGDFAFDFQLLKDIETKQFQGNFVIFL